MRTLLPFLACLMLLLTGLSGAAHAAEAAGGALGGVAFTVHSDGDGDEVPADGDSGVLHHHASCHGHDTGEPARPVAALAHMKAAAKRLPPPVATLSGTRAAVAERPPQA
ncbi:hypothetical protein [Sphingomonas adhaesiva]|uniref:hypothetical protein n=1 Tax=Sphingomonas adhaesiva TaxID=28212 RepID=UPI002FF6F1F9